jgi:predicted membrane protein
MLRLVFALAISTWLGSVVSLTYLVTPTAHGVFDPRDARRLLRPLFPRHYGLGIGCGFVALATVLVGKASLPYEHALRLAVPTAIALVCTVIGRQVVLPRLRRLDGDDPRFTWMHQVSVMLNSTTLGALVLAMAAAVTR